MRTVGGSAGRCAPPAPLARVTAAVLSALVVAALALLPAQAVPQQLPGELTVQDVEAWLDGAVPVLLAREAIPGAAISVVHDGQVLTERGYGMADLGSAGPGSAGSSSADPGSAGSDTAGSGSADRAPVPMDPQRTLLRVGSISKVPVAIAVMQLVERGELDLDAPITTYTDLAPAPTFDTPVTMRHLLTHTAGYEETLRGLFRRAPGEMPTLRDYLVSEAPPQIHAPGTTPSYSNYGYALAAQIVEEVSGQDIGEYLSREVLAPIGAGTATYQQPLPAALAPRVARAYPSSRAAPIGFELFAPWPAGSLSASAADMSALMLALLDLEGSPVLGPDALATMYAPGLSKEQLGTRAEGHQMALGLMERDRNRHRILGHDGDLIHSHAAFQIYPEDGTGIFIGLNGSGVNPGSTVVLRHDLLNAFTDRYYPLEDDPPPTLPTSGEHAAAAAGTYIPARRYRSSFVRAYGPLQTLSVRADGDALLISARTDASGVTVRLHETAPWVFEDESGGHRVAISLDADGDVEAIGLVAAVTLLPAPGWYTPVLYTLVVSLAILAITLVALPVQVIIRRRAPAARPLPRTERRLHGAGLLAALAALGGMGLWMVVASRLLSIEPAPAPLLRGAQLLTLLGILGVLPSTWWAARLWSQRSWVRAGAVTVLAVAFAGFTLFALAGGLLLPDISY